jgi:hypothetical protein
MTYQLPKRLTADEIVERAAEEERFVTQALRRHYDREKRRFVTALRIKKAVWYLALVGIAALGVSWILWGAK